MGLRDDFFCVVRTAGNKQSTADAYWSHVEGYIRFVSAARDQWTHPGAIDHVWINRYLMHLYRNHHASARTRNQALSALKFMYANLLDNPVEEKAAKGLRAKQPKHTRKNLISKNDLALLIRSLPMPSRLIVMLMYGGAMRLADVMELRVKDIHFDDCHIQVHDTKHDHFRTVPFPRSLHNAVRHQIELVRAIHSRDAIDNPNGVPLPDARRRKAPNDARSVSWYWLLPSDKLSRDKETGFFGRYHVDVDNVRKVIRGTIQTIGINRRITPHDIRRTAATRMHYEMGMPLARLQYILGHARLEQTREYILEDEIQIDGSMSPLDALPSLD